MQKNIVISASRRTDLVGCYPEILVDKLNSFPPENVHTVVIWTKNPINIFMLNDLNKKLLSYKQIYIHLTITGMGGSELEPGIPQAEKILEILPKLVKFVSNPERITWRFDPIIRAVKNDKLFTNLIYFDNLLEKIASHGIKICRTSWVFPYKKVCSHLNESGYKLILPTHSEMLEDYNYMDIRLKKMKMNLAVCAMEGFNHSQCIDGHLFSLLHPDKIPCSELSAHGQRKLCGCTESFDIGSYGLKCHHGCIYCYANPVIM
ncbi:DUF1848 family protein [Candidatus Poribacteria bacterium]|nr:DUF1848 family protein [Candidatus Poribacteria bacterium]